MSDAATTLRPRLPLGRLAPECDRALSALDEAAIGPDPAISELIRIRASQINGCAYCIDMHTKDARAAGESEQRLYALSAWRETPFFSAKERAALALAEAMTLIAQGHAPDDVYEEAARHFEPGDLARLIWQITAINAWNRIAITARLVPGKYQPTAVGQHAAGN